MLMDDIQWAYLVWPSWKTAYTTSWNELKQRIGGPLPDEFIDINVRASIDAGYVRNDAVPSDVFSGAFGNGIFRWRRISGQVWLGYELFRDEADFLPVPSMEMARDPET